MKDLEKPIVLSGGGTGGHIFPAHALAHELLSQGYQVFIFSDGRGQQFKDPSLQTIKIASSQLQGGISKKLKGGLELIQGIGSALYHLHRLKPQCVVGFGGYASFPTLVASAILRLPTIIHQADAYFGRANRKLARVMTHIATSFPYVENIPPSSKKKVCFTGLPVRSDIQPAPYRPSLNNEPFHLLVTGGSQGARIFGEILPKAIHLLPPSLQKRLQITQQCRSESLEITRELYNKTKAQVELSPFLDRMGERYKHAHFVISRGGASSVVETALVGRPALFIPYPYAMDNHQFYNAQQAVQAKGGWLMEEKDFTSHNLAALLLDLMTTDEKLIEAAANIGTIAIPDASKRLAHLVTLTTA